MSVSALKHSYLQSLSSLLLNTINFYFQLSGNNTVTLLICLCLPFAKVVTKLLTELTRPSLPQNRLRTYQEILEDYLKGNYISAAVRL